MSYLQTKLITHRQAVLRLYKAAVKNERDWCADRDQWRLRATLIRARFDANKDEKDMLKAGKLLVEGEKELNDFKHPYPLQFPNSPGGVAYNREPPSSDWVMDLWHPMEKAQFPDYFAKRDKLKKDYVDWYVKKYGITKYNPEIEGHIHEIDDQSKPNEEVKAK